MEIKMKEKNPDILTPQGLESGDKPQRMRLKKKTECNKCGDCCSSGPALLKEDISLFVSGILDYGNTYAIREGELVRSYKDGEVYESFVEIVKIKEKDSGKECFFYEGKGVCGIYENRPAQCRDYKCWETEPVFRGLENEGLKRSDIFGSIGALMKMIERHEERCSYKKLSDALDRNAKGEEGAVEEIMDMLQFDTYIRPFIAEKFELPPHAAENALNLMLGRPLADTINEFGFKVERQGDEYILLPIKPQKEGEDGK
jgi:Fe-S-cluster containining protein